MPRSRSGSFYCPLEPAWAPLSISQKAAISTAPTAPTSSSSISSSTPAHSRRHARTPSFDGADQPTSVTLPPAKYESTFGPVEPLSIRGASQYRTQKHAWTPSKPSPLRRQTTAAAPLCPSALWKQHSELLPLYQSYPSQQHKPKPRSHTSMSQSVTRHAFLSGPMGEKTHMYGLRVAWCVFGDVKEELAKEIFVSGTQAGYSTSAAVGEDNEDQTEHVEDVQSDALSPPPAQSRLRREHSFVWDVQGPLVTPDLLSEDITDAHFDNLSDTDSDSEYSEASDEDIESAESSDLDLDLSLDDEEEVERDIMNLLKSAGIADRNGDKLMDGTAPWDLMSFEI